MQAKLQVSLGDYAIPEFACTGFVKVTAAGAHSCQRLHRSKLNPSPCLRELSPWKQGAPIQQAGEQSYEHFNTAFLLGMVEGSSKWIGGHRSCF